MKTIEPQILMSRVLSFVFAAALLTMIVLIVTLSRMSPLNRAQIFFMTSAPLENTDVRIAAYYPDSENFETFKRNFAQEYVVARNEVSTDLNSMRAKWGTGASGLVHSWSSPDVYAAFTQTKMFYAMMSDAPLIPLRCPVDITGLSPRGPNRYAVSFKYLCYDADNAARASAPRDYTVIVGLSFPQNNTVRWLERLDNPLGMQVAEYTIEFGGSDPLDFAN